MVRLLAELTALELSDAKQSFAERLGSWLDWTDAISLSAVLHGGAAQGADAQAAASFSVAWALAAPGESAHGVAAAQATRLRADLVRAITLDSLFMPAKPVKPGPLQPVAASVRVVDSAVNSAVGRAETSAALSDSEADFLPYRRSYAKHQRAMGTRIASLRIDVRAALAQASPTLGRLAALDGAMDEMLGVHERALLSTVPRLLQKRFERLHRAQPPEQPSQQQPGRPAAWLQGFGKDMQAVLLAELEVRMQPVDGLLEALGQEPSPLGKRPQ